MFSLEQYTAVVNANIQALQRFYALAWETAGNLLMLQMKGYQALISGNGGMEQAFAGWQKFAEESARKTAELSNQHIDTFARLQTNVAEDVERSARAEPVQYTNRGPDRTLVADDESAGGRRRR